MANHRMFSNRVANSANFLQMPAESQLLFFHMVLRADDDGIVESYPLMKLLGTTPDSFRVLVARGFIKQLNEDQVVVISEWLEHNTIRADRKVDSMYLPMLLEKYPETEIVVVKPRSDVSDNSKRLDRPWTAEVKLSKGKKAVALQLASPPLEVREVRTNNEGEEKQLKKRTRRDPRVWALQEKLYDILEKDNGVRPTHHWGDYQRIVVALALIKESDIISMVEDAVAVKTVHTVREVLTTRQIDIYRQENL